MANPQQDLIGARGQQMFPTLSAADLERIRPFGECANYRAGSALAVAGQAGIGLVVILSGDVEISQHSETGERRTIVIHHPGSFMGELAQLSGRPSLVDAYALSDVEALVIPPPRLRALLVAEAALGEQIMRALILRRVGLIESGAGPVIIGPDDDADVLRLVNFLARNGHPYQRLDPANDLSVTALAERMPVTPDEMPIVLCPGGQMLRNPSESQLARCIGIVGTLDATKLYDLIVVGAGPAGLATSVYAASEGLSVLTLDCRSFGGQAGASARIENYLGFPTGISGMALMGRAFSQAQKFGVEIAIPDEVVHLECGNDPLFVQLATGERIQARCAVLATGARYRRLGVARLEEFEGSSVHYWASPLEAELAADNEVMLVGGGNSAGQATVFLSSRARRVTLVARRALSETMSQYLIERIAAQPNIDVVIGSEVAELDGSGHDLRAVVLRDRSSGSKRAHPVRYLFSFIGADPNTDWLLTSGIALDRSGFVLASAAGAEGELPLQTSRAGIFAVGDVRSTSVKRVASAVGDGAQVVASVHAYLARQARQEMRPGDQQVRVSAA